MLCNICLGLVTRKSGKIIHEYMSKQGLQQKTLQSYRCENGHQTTKIKLPQYWSEEFIEHVVFVYINCLSLNTTIEIIREQYDADLLTKKLILDFIELVADAIPSTEELNNLYNPLRSGYLAFDGVWFRYDGTQIVLLVAFDPVTFDIVAATWSNDETQLGYELLIAQATKNLGSANVKGVYSDGDNGFMAAKNKLLPTVPLQLCVFHKELRMGQFVPVARVSNSHQMTAYQKHDIKVFQLLFRAVIYAKSKEDSIVAFEKLKAYVSSGSHNYSERFTKAFNSLNHNFKYTLTHFDHPDMKRDNNIIECFNGCLKPRFELMKSFKKEFNLDRYLKLFLADFRFHKLRESTFKERRDSCPIELGMVLLPKYYNFLKLLRQSLKLKYVLKKP